MLENMWEPVILSLKVATIALIFSFIIGVGAAYFLARKNFPGKVILETLIMLPLVLPPTVVGFILIIVFGKHGFVGQLILMLFDQSLLFTWYAAVIASTVVAIPLMYQSAKTGFLSVDKNIETVALVDGVSKFRIFTHITMPLAKHALITGSILAFARALGEFGATLMFAGNIPGRTTTMPTAIYSAIQAGNMEIAWTYVVIIITISFFMMWFIRSKEN